MIRLIIAAALLRSTGAIVEYGVRRIYKGVKGKGTTVLSTTSLREAKAKYAAMRIADTDTITITVAAVIAQRKGTVAAKSAVKENDSE